MPLNFENIDLGSFGITDKPIEDPAIDPVQTQLKSNVSEALKVNPDQHSENLKLSKESGVPPVAVKGAETDIKQYLNFNKIDFNTLSKRNPNTAKYLTDFDNAAASSDEIYPLQLLEDVVSDIGQYGSDLGTNFERGQHIVEGSEIGNRRMMRAFGLGEFTEEEAVADLTRLAEFDKIHKEQPVQEYGYIAGIPQTVAEQLPIMGSMLATGVKGGAIGATAGLPVAVVTRQPAAIGVGAKFGMKAGMAVGAFELESGLAFNEFADMQDEFGGKIDQKLAASGAAVVGGVNAWLEMFSLKQLGKTITPAVKMALKNRIKRSLLTETGREAALRIGGAYAKYAAAEGVTEGLQEFVNVIGAEVMKFMDDQAFGDQDLDTALENIGEAAPRVGEAFVKGTQAGFGFGAVTTTLSVVEYNTRKKQLQENEQRQIDDINNASAELKSIERNKDEFHQFVENADGDKNTNVYMDSAQTSLYLQEFTQDEIAEDPALKLLQDKLDEVRETGGDLSVSVADFATDITGSEHYDSLRPNMTLDPESSSPFRQGQEQKQFQDYMKRTVEEAQQNASQYVEAQDVFTATRDQLIDTGRMTPQQAGVAAQIVPAFVAVQAKRQGKTVSEVYADMGLTIEGPQTGKMDELKARETEVLLQVGYRYESGKIYDNKGKPYTPKEGSESRSDLQGYPLTRGEFEQLEGQADVFRQAFKGVDTTGLEGWFLKKNQRKSNREITQLEKNVTNRSLWEFGTDIKIDSQTDWIRVNHPEQRVTYAQQQDFGDIKLTEDVKVAGKKVTVSQSAQKQFDDTMSRKDTVKQLLDCLR